MSKLVYFKVGLFPIVRTQGSVFYLLSFAIGKRLNIRIKHSPGSPPDRLTVGQIIATLNNFEFSKFYKMNYHFTCVCVCVPIAVEAVELSEHAIGSG